MAEQIVKVMTHKRDLSSLREYWQNAVQNPNADFDFYATILESRPEIKAPAVFVLYEGAEPRGMLIGRIEESRLIEVKLGYLTLFRPKLRLLTFIYGGVCGNISEESAPLFIKAIRKHSKQNGCDAVLFNMLPMDSVLLKVIKDKTTFLLRDYVLVPNPHWSAELLGSEDEFLAKMSHNHREGLRRQARRIENEFQGRMEVKHFSNESDVLQLCHDADAISQKSYQRAIGGGLINSLEMANRLSLYARSGSLEGVILYIDKKPCAYWISTRYKGTLFLDYTGYDPAFKKYGFGTYLLLKMVENFRITAHGSRIDFGPGDAEYKQRFGDNKWVDTQVMFFSPALKGLLLNLTRQIELSLRLLSRKAFSAKIIQFIKTTWRKNLSKKAQCNPEKP